ncbi:sialidase domain-containing protein [Paenibacillus sp. CMAA1364]
MTSLKLSFVAMVLLFSTVLTSSNVNAQIYTPVISTNNITFAANHSGYDLSPSFTGNNLWNLDKGSIAIRFTTSNSSSVQSLFSVSNKSTATPNSHFHIYVKSNTVGFEIRNQTGGDYEKRSVRVPLLSNREHSIVLTADPVVGYTIFLDGQKVFVDGLNDFVTTRGYGFFNVIPGANSAKIGLTDRNGSNANKYPFIGGVTSFQLFIDVISNVDAILFTKPSIYNPVRSTFLFDKDEWNSPAFRIPSLLTTKSNNILAIADIRYGDSNDSPNNIDIGIRRSLDGGATWTNPALLLNFLDYPNVPTSQLNNSASYIDSVVVEGNNNRIFHFVDAFKGGVGQANSINSSGYTDINGIKYLTLVNSTGKKFYVAADKRVVDSTTQAFTTYSVNDDFELLNNGSPAGNIFYKNSPLSVEATAFIIMSFSDDQGASWSKPQIINNQIKSNDMKFLGTAPGVGIQLKNGSHVGRLLVPMYYTSSLNSTEYSAVMYSDDNGLTWILGESPNNGRIGGAQKLHESQVIEMPDGQIKMFVRTNGKTAIATSFDGGLTWDDQVELSNELIMSSSSGCQLSIINYSQLIQGRQAVIFANPAATTRSNGAIRVGLLKENGTYISADPNKNNRIIYSFDWISKKIIRSGEFAYSSLTELPNGNIGILFEENNTKFTLDHLVYEEYTIQSLLN